MSIAVQILRASSSLEAAARRAFRAHAVTPAQFNVLNIVADHEHGVPLSAVAKELLVDRANVTGLVQKLGAEKLIELKAAAADARVKLVLLTPRGRKLWKQTNELYEAGLAELARRVGPKEMAAMMDGLRKIEEVANDLHR